MSTTSAHASNDEMKHFKLPKIETSKFIDNKFMSHYLANNVDEEKMIILIIIK